MTRGGQGREAKSKMPYQLEMKDVESVRKVKCRIGQKSKMPYRSKRLSAVSVRKNAMPDGKNHIIQIDCTIFYTKHIWYRAPVTHVSS